MSNLSSEPRAPSVIEAMREQISRTTLPEPARPWLRQRLTVRPRLRQRLTVRPRLRQRLTVRPRLRQRLTVRPRLALGGGLTAVGGIAAAVVLAVGGGAGAPAAYAITDNPDGSVTITLNDLSAIPALNAKLAADGVAVRAAPVEAGCVAPVRAIGPGGRPLPPRTLEARPLNAISPRGPTPLPGALRSITFRPPTEPGRTLVMAVSPSGIDLTLTVIRGVAPRCVGEPIGRAHAELTGGSPG